MNQNEPFWAKVVGDGAKHIEREGKFIPFVSCSATDRLRDGEKAFVFIRKSGYADLEYLRKYRNEE